jgi:hypothetical protein
MVKITAKQDRRRVSEAGPGSDPDNRLYAERVVEASGHVGKTWIEELRWLVDLAQRSPQQLTRELLDPESLLVYEVGWFSREVSIAFAASDQAWIVEAAGYLEVQLRSLLERNHAVFQVAEVTFVLNRRTDDGWKGAGRASRLEASHRAKNSMTRFVLSAYRIIELEGVRLRECAAPECRRIFVRQKRAIFCGKKCSQREQTKRFRERHPEHAKIRQRQYYERKSKQKRPAVIVPRNPRRTKSK